MIRTWFKSTHFPGTKAISIAASLKNMSQQHLGAGSQEPPKTKGLLRLYSMEYCPYAQRSRLVLKTKNVPHDIVNINLNNKPDWYFKIHPEGKVPALYTGSENIIESLVICDYLDEKYPNPPLYPKDAQRKKRDKELIEKFAQVTAIIYKCLLQKENKTPEEWAQEFAPLLDEYLSELQARGTTFFGGERPGMLDYMVWPWSERAGTVSIVLGQKLPFEDKQLAALKQWHKAMKEDQACRETFHGLEEHAKILKMRLQNVPVDYDQISK